MTEEKTEPKAKAKDEEKIDHTAGYRTADEVNADHEVEHNMLPAND